VHPDLLTVPNVVLTRTSPAPPATRGAMAKLAADNLIAFLSGKGPLTPVNQPDAAAAGARAKA
jgi:gluconate 2-dehydrogenase